MKLNELGEFGLIDKLKAIFPCQDENVILGIGDDCAIISHVSSNHLLTTTDALQEEIHFNWQTISPYQLGWKSLAVNISDIAAMGGLPKFALLAFAIPGDYSFERIQEIAGGITDICLKFGVSVIGGNVTKSSAYLSITVTLMGVVEAGKAIKRSGAKVGDFIFVTGYPGESALGLDILKNKLNIDSVSLRDRLVQKHLCPIPRVKEGLFLASYELASSMIDISDGLISDLNQICLASRVGAKIYLADLPIQNDTTTALRRQQINEQDYLLYGGEEYELLFTVSPNLIDSLSELWKANSETAFTKIGEIVDFEKGLILVEKDGSSHSLIPKGFDHFKI